MGAEKSIIKFSSILKEQRLDAEYYKPVFLESFAQLVKHPCTQLKLLVGDVIGGPFGSTILVSQYRESGIPFLRIANVNDLFIDTRELIFIGEEIKCHLKRFIVGFKDIVSSRVGTIGLFSILSDEYSEWCLGSNLIAITDISKIKPLCLLAFLNSKYGKMQILRPMSGQVQQKITTQNIKNILIPNFKEHFQLRIEEKMVKAKEKQKIAYNKYRQAEDILFKSLGIDKESIEILDMERVFSVKKSAVGKVIRFDADFFHPKFSSIKELIQKNGFELKPVSDFGYISTEKIDPSKEEYENRKFKYVPIAKISESGELYDWAELLNWELPSRARMLIKKNDILVPSLNGTFGKTALVSEEFDGEITTTGCFVFRPKKAVPEFLFVYFRSLLFKRQLEQQVTGGIMSSVPKGILKNLLVPDIDTNAQEAIAVLVKDFLNLSNEHRILVTEAISETEKIIEGIL